MTAFVLITLGGLLMLGSFVLRALRLPRFVSLFAALIGAATTAVGAFRL